MAAAVSERVMWHPETPEQEAAVRTVLAEILATPHFCNSKRYPAFLEYVVNAVLSGHGDELKERTIGIEVFGRRPDYDTNSDTVVRYTAGEVRKRLALYYGEADHPSTIRIYLPVGSYVPELILAPKAPLEPLGETVVHPPSRALRITSSTNPNHLILKANRRAQSQYNCRRPRHSRSSLQRSPGNDSACKPSVSRESSSRRSCFF